LDQSYERVAESRYRYESASRAFVAMLETNAAGFVTRYPGLWILEGA
ncbi:MAG: putative glycolipid-binding domain-containing protein, partial [Acidimicrobiia bacterium]